MHINIDKRHICVYYSILVPYTYKLGETKTKRKEEKTHDIWDLGSADDCIVLQSYTCIVAP